MDKSPRLLSVDKVLFKHEKLFTHISDSLAAIDGELLKSPKSFKSAFHKSIRPVRGPAGHPAHTTLHSFKQALAQFYTQLPAWV
jgi:hypothetical protein